MLFVRRGLALDFGRNWNRGRGDTGEKSFGVLTKTEESDVLFRFLGVCVFDTQGFSNSHLAGLRSSCDSIATQAIKK